MFMPMDKRIAIIILSSFFAIVILILFQLKWMQQSRDLLEEAFHQKVNMALCSAVEEMAAKGCGSSLQKSCSSNMKSGDCNDHLTELSRDPRFEQALKSSLSFYDINLDYQFQIVDNTQDVQMPEAYSCSLNPLLNTNAHLLEVQFPDQEKYILERMGFMILASILILFFIGGVFVLANHYLLRQERMKRLNIEFFNHMAHEFRTPLTNIQLANRLLQKQMQIPKQNRFGEIIQRESAQLQHQLEAVLQLARMEESEYRLQPESVQLEDLMQKVIEEMNLQAQERNGEVRLLGTDQTTNCFGDKLHLHHAFRNLIDNALKYSGASPQLEISIDNMIDDVIIRFKDNGPGITPKQQALIFRSFHRLSSADKKGFGLGLSYVKKVVELHQGRLQVISQVDVGSSFEIYLPKKKSA